MRTEQAGQARLLKAYQQEIAQRQARAPERVAGEGSPSAPPAEEESPPRLPRELSKGRLLDIYG
jgi:hypothetical protein